MDLIRFCVEQGALGVYQPGFGRYGDMGFVPESVTVSILNTSVAAGLFALPPARAGLSVALGWDASEAQKATIPGLMSLQGVSVDESVVFVEQIMIADDGTVILAWENKIKTDVVFTEDNFYIAINNDPVPDVNYKIQVEVQGKFKAITDVLRAQLEFSGVELSSVAYRGLVETLGA